MGQLGWGRGRYRQQSGDQGQGAEEEAQGGAFDSKRQQQYVTVTQWSDADPVAVWTKATGVFFPILANPYGLVTATIAAE